MSCSLFFFFLILEFCVDERLFIVSCIRTNKQTISPSPSPGTIKLSKIEQSSRSTFVTSFHCHKLDNTQLLIGLNVDNNQTLVIWDVAKEEEKDDNDEQL